ncbi:hypothetical protein QQS21_012281 [Conoideocrella luteorostrata]|uniref:Zn(2)-C6 fungal-type domain-containing protein n=1 Tax=Conoideocrella luteorostrata TaxID=1105319 RepID=A0AAJ0FV05_9HYPO|nr:hypothetical protein QQS21_012281 [Conoideocrella luteorostrata]
MSGPGPGHVDGSDGALLQPGQKKPAKLFHKKSRTGCQRCRARRVKVSFFNISFSFTSLPLYSIPTCIIELGFMSVHDNNSNNSPTPYLIQIHAHTHHPLQCDELKPICSNCTRLSLTCIYDRTKPSPSSEETTGASMSPAFIPVDHSRASTSTSTNDITIPLHPSTITDPPESESRRKLELSLFHHYFTETGHSIALDQASFPFIVSIISNMALRSDALLYSVYVVAALHIFKKSKNTDQQALQHCGTYLNMSIRELTHQIEHLSAENVDEVCMTSSMLRIYTFVRLQDRELTRPYAPPMQWLRTTLTSSSVFRQAAELTARSPSSAGMQMIGIVAHLLGEGGDRSHSDGLLHLVRREKPHELVESWDENIEDAYLATLNYIGRVWKAMQDGDPPGSVARRLIVFPLLVDSRFVDMVEERRPRALVIMAHYFALLSMLRGFWWTGDAGPREVRAIDAEVKPEWEPLMAWPLEILRDQIVFTQDMDVNKLSEYAAGLKLQV